MTHTCFRACRKPADCLLGFENDGRSECTKLTQNNGILCLLPEAPCENFVTASEICLDDEKSTCLDWSVIILSIFIGNMLQLVFESSMLYSLEVTFKPTSLEKL